MCAAVVRLKAILMAVVAKAACCEGVDRRIVRSLVARVGMRKQLFVGRKAKLAKASGPWPPNGLWAPRCVARARRVAALGPGPKALP